MAKFKNHTMTDKPKRGRGRPRKNILDQAVAIPYERSVSDDPTKQSMIDLMETGRSITQFGPEGMRRIDPLGPEAEVALYNSEHSDSKIHVEKIQSPFPKDWDKMGKIEKLAWYTKNRMK